MDSKNQEFTVNLRIKLFKIDQLHFTLVRLSSCTHSTDSIENPLTKLGLKQIFLQCPGAMQTPIGGTSSTMNKW
jgi:hypothetical protein